MIRLAAAVFAKDEEDIVAETIRNLWRQGVDHVYAYDNMSTDQTGEILSSLAECGPMTIHVDEQIGYYQSEKMTAAMMRAYAEGYDWFMPVDADEWWEVARGWSIRSHLASVGAEGADVVAADLLHYFPTARDVADESNPYRRIEWRVAEPSGLPKVCVRCADDMTIEMGNHAATSRRPLVTAGGLLVRHVPYRSGDQFVRKVRNGGAAYAAAPDLDESYGAHWRQYGRLLDEGGEAAVRGWFEQHFYYVDPQEAGLVFDPIRA